MTRGPAKGANRSTSSVDRVANEWGAFIPDWISVLAEECDASSQRQIAEVLGVSTALISNVLGNKYTGDLTRIEQEVNARFLRSEVDCPVLGTIPAADCFDHQGRQFSTANPVTVKLFRACPNCPNLARRRTR